MENEKELKWEDYEYSGEPAGGDWLYFNLFRTHGWETEEYIVDKDAWEDTEDAHKAHYGYMFTTRMSDDVAKELMATWRKNYLIWLKKQEGEEEK